MPGHPLLDRLDQCAETLLDEAFNATTSGGEPADADETAEKPRLADKIKAFDSVRDWMSDRQKLIPEEKGKSKGEQLRDQFHRRKASGRRGRKTPEEAANLDDSAGEPAPIPNGSGQPSA
jgi:hypothetical protein